MKLRALVEAEVTPAVFNKHLVLYVDELEGSAFYIITDIPPISKEKYNKLIRLSFDEGSLASYLFINQIDKDWSNNKEFLGYAPNPLTNNPTWAYTWKEFIAHMKEKHPPDDGDDFDE